MHPVIRFRTAAFDLSQEPPHPIDPIFGHALLAWIRARVPDVEAMSEPAAEAWGWSCDLDWGERCYLLGARADDSADDGANGLHAWAIFVDRHRTPLERLFGRGKMATDDACLRFLYALLRAEAAFVDVELTWE